MTDARKIKISFTFEKKWARNEELLKAALCSREGRDGRYFRISSYFPFSYRHSVHLRNTATPTRKLVLSCETVLFSRRLGKRANFAFMDHQKREHNAHCALSMYQRFAPSSATSKRMLASLKLGTVLV